MIERTDVAAQPDGTLLLVRYEVELSRDAARRLIENLHRELDRASGAAESVPENVAGDTECKGKGW